MSDELVRLEAKVDKLDDRLDAIDKHLAVYNSELHRHIEGVEQNRTRIEKLEEPAKALSLIKKWAVWVTAIGVAAGVIFRWASRL